MSNDATVVDPTTPVIEGEEVETPAPQAVSPTDDVSSDDTQVPSTPDPTPETPGDTAQAREEGKLRKLQEEIKRAGLNPEQLDQGLSQLKEARERLSNIEESAMQTPDSYKQALMNFNGLSETQAAQQVDRLRAQGKWGTAPAGQQADPIAAAQDAARKEVYMQQYMQNIRQQFYSALPALDPKNLAAENHPMAKMQANVIDAEVQRVMKADSSLNYATEAVRVYKAMTGKTDDDIKQAQEKGYYQGLSQANASNNAAGKAGVTGTPATPSSHGLSAQQLAEAKEEGLTPEQYAEYDSGPVQMK